MTLSSDPEARKRQLANLRPSKKGDVNKGAGRPKGSRSVSTDIKRCIKALQSSGKLPMDDEGGALYPMAMQLISIAMAKGIKDSDRLKALDMIFDRVEGKAIQKVQDITELKPTPINVSIQAVDNTK